MPRPAHSLLGISAGEKQTENSTDLALCDHRRGLWQNGPGRNASVHLAGQKNYGGRIGERGIPNRPPFKGVRQRDAPGEQAIIVSRPHPEHQCRFAVLRPMILVELTLLMS